MPDTGVASESPSSTNVVVGSGIGGLATAVTLAAEDVDVVVVEKADAVGGSSGISAGQLWVPDSHLARSAGIEDSVEAAVSYLTNAAGTLYERPAEARHFVESAGEAVAYFADTIDLELQVIRSLPDIFIPTNTPNRRAVTSNRCPLPPERVSASGTTGFPTRHNCRVA